MFVLEGECKSIDNRTENFEKLSDAVVALSFIDKLEEDIVDRTTNKRAEAQELAIYPVKRGLEKIALPWILAVKKVKQLQHKRLINVLFRVARIQLAALDKAEEQLVDDLEVRPSQLKYRLCLLYTSPSPRDS